MRKIEDILNKLLVQLFNDILQIEEKSLKNTQFTDLSITEIHTIEAIGLDRSRTMGEIAHDLRITVGTLTTAITKPIVILKILQPILAHNEPSLAQLTMSLSTFNGDGKKSSFTIPLPLSPPHRANITTNVIIIDMV